MARFISISGPASTGKTSILDELAGKIGSSFDRDVSVVLIPDVYESVWQDLVDNEIFQEFTEINTDSEYLSVYILRLIKYYEEIMDYYEEVEDTLVVFDNCWVDLAIYTIINMWYTRALKELQEEILARISKYDDRMDKIYFTQFDKSKEVPIKYRSQFKMSNAKVNRPLELQYYNIFNKFKNAEILPTSDVAQAADFIISDIKNLGYI